MNTQEFKEKRSLLKQTHGRELAEGVKTKEYLAAAAPLVKFAKVHEERFSTSLLGDWLIDNPEWRPSK